MLNRETGDRGEQVPTPPFTEGNLERLKVLEAVLNKGRRIQSFLIHSTLARYIRIEDVRTGGLINTGEGTDFYSAAMNAIKSKEEKRDQRVMGSPNPVDPLDNFVLGGNVVNFLKDGEQYTVSLEGSKSLVINSKSLSRAVKKAFEE